MSPQLKSTVYLREKELGLLTGIVRGDFTPAVALLREKLERAIILSDDEFPRRFVTIGSKVEYVDFLSDQALHVTLTTHDAFGSDETRVSVGSPLGAALIGLCSGDIFSWTAGDRKLRTILVVSVTPAVRAPDDESRSTAQ